MKEQLSGWIYGGGQWVQRTPSGTQVGYVQESADASGDHIGRFGWYGTAGGGKAPSIEDARILAERHMREAGYDVPAFKGWP